MDSTNNTQTNTNDSVSVSNNSYYDEFFSDTLNPLKHEDSKPNPSVSYHAFNYACTNAVYKTFVPEIEKELRVVYTDILRRRIALCTALNITYDQACNGNGSVSDATFFSVHTTRTLANGDVYDYVITYMATVEDGADRYIKRTVWTMLDNKPQVKYEHFTYKTFIPELFFVVDLCSCSNIKIVTSDGKPVRKQRVNKEYFLTATSDLFDLTQDLSMDHPAPVIEDDYIAIDEELVLFETDLYESMYEKYN
tara:strand:- start:1238 stop:1990 length:753 start_codon:yes stop_codon:yes gene_type:complete